MEEKEQSFTERFYSHLANFKELLKIEKKPLVYVENFPSKISNPIPPKPTKFLDGDIDKSRIVKSRRRFEELEKKTYFKEVPEPFREYEPQLSPDGQLIEWRVEPKGKTNTLLMFCVDGDYDNPRKTFLFDKGSINRLMRKYNYKSFDNKLHEMKPSELSKCFFNITEDGYLHFRYEFFAVHRFLRMKEVKELAKLKKCPLWDIHVHHKNEKKDDNRLRNLQALHKDDHAKEHGYNTWAEFQQSRVDSSKIPNSTR